MEEFRVHRVRFFQYQPNAVHCLAYDNAFQKLALSRSNGSVEIWSAKDNWYQEKIIPPTDGGSVEALLWWEGRLFSAGLHGNLQEYNLRTLTSKYAVPCNNGAIWCLALNGDHSLIAMGTEDGCVVLFEITAIGVEYYRTLDRQEGRILSLAWYDPENVIVTGGIDNIRIWSVKSGHAIQRLTMGRLLHNKETIVWALAVTRDFTIVSGDSRGMTSFWNGHQGTLIKAFQSHKADVLALCVDAAGTSVFTSGVDPAVAQFEFMPVSETSDWSIWVRTTVHSQHSHDVRALALTDTCLVSAGVDCQLIVNELQLTQGIRMCRHHPPIPHIPLVHTAKAVKMVLLQYATDLELWRLGSTDRISEKDGEILPLSSNPLKLLQLTSHHDEHIVTSAISSDGCSIAYSDRHCFRLFSLTMENPTDALPTIQLKRIRMQPCPLPARSLAFTEDGSHLLSLTCEGTVQVFDMTGEQSKLEATLQSPSDSSTGVHLLAVNSTGKYIATGDHSNNVHVYSLKKLKHVCSLPQYAFQPTAMAFHPSAPELVVAYSDRRIVEYSIAQKEYTAWSRLLASKPHPQWLRGHSRINQIMYHPRQPQQFFLRENTMLWIIDKTQPLPEPSQKLYRQYRSKKKSSKKKDVSPSEDKHAFHTCTKYKFLLHLDILDDDFLLIVERPPLAILDNLPPVLIQKKFGT
ncbi:U3 small nucleolar RNA-associated protein 4 [Lamellibrachia satsuma]|nr:U3 small nucleolar RNA-associated protein 4 [Lamellibrachia satsuma]